jgi:hypothetical protein
MDPVSATWVQAAAAVASLLVTIGLAALTFSYVRETRRMADQMAQQSEPIVVGRIEPFGHMLAQFVLTNVGLGPALGVELRLTLDHESVWRDDLIEPGKSEFFFLPVDGGVGASAFKALAGANKVLTGTLTFKDRGGRVYPTREIRVDFTQLNADWDNAHWQLRKSDLLLHAEAIKESIDKLSKQSEQVTRILRDHLTPLTTASGLALSVTTLRNLRSICSGSDKLEPIDPLGGGHEIFVEVLGVDSGTAFRIWNYFRGHSEAAQLEEIEGVTSTLAGRIREAFDVRNA